MEKELIADYVVVGSGAGGGPLAARLALAGFEVLVLEAGTDQGAKTVYQAPIFHGFATEDTDMSWEFFVQHYSDKAKQNSAYDPKYDEDKGGIFYPRAGTLGGCTAHNALITIYPHNSDWDELATLTGDSSWSAENMRDIFEKRLERCGYIAKPLLAEYNPSRHGFEGWLGTQQANPQLAAADPQLIKVIKSAGAVLAEQLALDLGGAIQVLQTFFDNDPVDVTAALLRNPGQPLQALQEVLLRHLDPNDWRINRRSREGLFSVPLATWNGHRNGPRDFLRATAANPQLKLRIEENALASRVLLDASRTATGVQYLKGAHLYRADKQRDKAEAPVACVARARREVILAGGTFNTPQLLMLSGIGPKAQLAANKIECLVPLEGVGKNLQDRYEVGVVCEMEQDFPVLKGSTFQPPKPGDPPDPILQQWQTDGTGLFATNGAILAIIRRSEKSLPNPDLFMFGLPGLFKGYFVHYSDLILSTHNKFTWAILKGHTKNTTGEVKLRSTDPRDVPDINFHYFGENNPGAGDMDDLQAVVEGVKFVRSIMNHPLLGGAVTKTEMVPGGDIRDDAAIAEVVKKTAWGHHACGTCKMGRKDDPNAVVDGAFRVYGTQRLRIVDASIFPKIPGFFIVTSVYMIAEKAAEVIAAQAGAPTGGSPATTGS